MYILQIGNGVFIQVKTDEVVVTSDCEKATKYNTIGEAMKTASELNKLISNPVIKIIRYD